MVEVLYDDEMGECKSRCPVPTALHANSEARGVALEYYELAFATQKAEAMVYFDFGVDALFLGVGNFSPSRKDPASLLFRALKRQDIERLEHLVADDFINSFLLGIYADDDDDDTDASLSGGITDGDDSDSDTDEVQSSLTKFGLDGLQSLTIVDGLGNYDFVIQEIKNNGEFHVWNILGGGKPVPLVNPNTVDYPGMLYFSEIWRSAELAKYIGRTRLTTLRYVGRKRLRQEEAWKKRINFMDQVVLPGTFNSCLYPKDGVIDRIVGMYLLDPEAFQNLREYFGGADPEYIYIAQNPCVCPIGHKHKEPCHWRLMDFNLRRALAKIDPAGDDPIEEAVPGAFPEESAVEEVNSHPLQIPSERVTVANSQIQEINLEQPSPAFQDLSLTEHKSTSNHQQVSPPTLVKAPFLWRLLDQLEHYLPSGIIGKFIVANVLISFGLLIYAILFLEVNQLWGPILGFGVCLSMNHLRAGTQPSSSPNLLAWLFSLTWHSIFPVFGLLKNHISYNKTAPARQIASLQQGTSSSNTLTAARQRFHKAFYVCMTFWIWLLLGLVSVALAFSLLKFLVELLSVLMLLVALLWLLGIWLMAHEMHNK